MAEAIKSQSRLPKKEVFDNMWLVVDFDGTCTVRDTTSVLPKLSSHLQSNGDDLEMRVSQFTKFEEHYYELYRAAQKQICPRSCTSLENALTILDRVSTKVTSKVSASGVLRGLCVPSKDIIRIIQREESLQEEVKLLSGCLEVLARARQHHGLKLAILSINWSPSLIDAALLHPLKQEHLLDDDASDVPIWSNSIDPEGIVKLDVPGALAKKNRIMKLQEQNAHVIYVGDSSTDLAALLAADVGILIGGSKSTLFVTEKWGIPLMMLKDYVPVNRRSSKSIIWTTNSWQEIRDFLDKNNLRCS